MNDATEITNVVFSALSDRKGFDEWFDQIDEELQSEIKTEISEAIAALRAQPAHSGDASKMVDHSELVKLSGDEIKAIAICKEAGNVSVSRVQRILNISYNRAQTLCESIIYAGQVDGLEVAPSLCGARNKRVANALEGKT